MILKFLVMSQALDYHCFPTGGSLLSPSPPTAGYLLLYRDVCGCHNCGGREGAIGIQWERPQWQVNILQCTRQPQRIVLAPNVNSPKIEQCWINYFPSFPKSIVLFSNVSLRYTQGNLLTLKSIFQGQLNVCQCFNMEFKENNYSSKPKKESCGYSNRTLGFSGLLLLVQQTQALKVASWSACYIYFH